jgi:hypothetical protein
MMNDFNTLGKGVKLYPTIIMRMMFVFVMFVLRFFVLLGLYFISPKKFLNDVVK